MKPALNLKSLRLFALLLLLTHSSMASAIGLLLPAVQKVRVSAGTAGTAALMGDFSAIGPVELVSGSPGEIDLIAFRPPLVDIDADGAGVGSGELLPFSLQGLEPDQRLVVHCGGRRVQNMALWHRVGVAGRYPFGCECRTVLRRD